MTKKKGLIQITLIFTGLLLIIATYFIYPKITEDKLIGSVVDEEQTDTTDDVKKRGNTFQNVEYRGFYNFNKPFMLEAEKANIFSEDSDIIYMTNMKVIIKIKEEKTIIITSDKGKYNKANYDCFFESNVKATDGETIILAENLDLLATEDYASIYNNVSLASKNGSLKADKVDYNFEAAQYKISMFNDEKIKIKLIK